VIIYAAGGREKREREKEGREKIAKRRTKETERKTYGFH
jgi:hypothetical protein